MEIVINTEEIGFSAEIPSLHIHTQGRNFDELLKNIQEAVELYYEEEKDNAVINISTERFYFNLPKSYTYATA